MRDVTPYPKRPKRTPRPKRPNLPDARVACERRANGACEARCGAGCLGRGDQAHHRRLRSQGGTDDLDNLLWTCRFCHSYIHANPAESYLRGWLVRGVNATVRVVS